MKCPICNKILGNAAAFKLHTETHKKFNVTKEELESLIFNDKLSMEKIAEKYGVSAPFVSHIRKFYGIKNQNELKAYNINKDEIKKLVDQGFSSSQIAKHYSCSGSTLCNYCKKYGIKLLNTHNEILSVFLRNTLTKEKFIEFQTKTDLEVFKWYNSQTPEHLKLLTEETIRMLRHEYKLDTAKTLKKNIMDGITKETLENLYKTKTLMEIAKIYGLAESTITEIKNQYAIPTDTKGESRPQKEIIKYINDLGVNLIKNTRKVIPPLEIDIYIEAKKLGIEYHGLYSHSDKFKEKNYHRIKYDKCFAKNIRLLQIFGDEWEFKQKICESRIANALGAIKNRLYARKCKTKEVPSDMALKFLEENHIQGKTGAKIHFGLYYNEELVYLLSLGALARAHTAKGKKVIEIKRSCPKLNTSVIGGLSKLFKTAKKYAQDNNYEVIRSYCDLRWGTGNSYLLLGFIKVNETQYTPHYVKNHHRFRNQSLRKTHEEKASNMTEAALRLAQGYKRIFDCGHQTWDYTIDISGADLRDRT